MDAPRFHAWLLSRVREPWPETVKTMLLSTGRSPESNFYRLTNDPKEIAENVGRMFLGTRWACAQCHNHPFERFPQSEYYAFAATFARVRDTARGIVHIERGEIAHPKTEKPAAPKFPADGDRRTPLAEWVVSHPQLGQAMANRVWALLMGRGLVHPVDDFRASNPPSDPERLAALGKLQTIPELVKAIARSPAYHRAPPKALGAEVLVDAIGQATGVPDSPRAIEIGDFAVSTYTLDVCGRNRPDFAGSLQQMLHLLNGEAVSAKAARAPLAGKDPVEDLYLRTVSRPPSAKEREHWEAVLKRGPREEILRDLLWALINSKEFQTCP
jgi:hypothetical protein